MSIDFELNISGIGIAHCVLLLTISTKWMQCKPITVRLKPGRKNFSYYVSQFCGYKIRLIIHMARYFRDIQENDKLFRQNLLAWPFPCQGMRWCPSCHSRVCTGCKCSLAAGVRLRTSGNGFMRIPSQTQKITYLNVQLTFLKLR